MFAPKKAELSTGKIEAFRAKNQAEYVRIFRAGQMAFQQAMQAIT